MTGLTFSGDGLLQRFSNQLGELGARAPEVGRRSYGGGPWEARAYTGGRGPQSF
jgi:hypothetical protein